jgi:hypothetical protein
MDVEMEESCQMTPSSSNDSLMEVEEEVQLSMQPATFRRYPILDQEWKSGIPQRVSASFVKMVSLRDHFPHHKEEFDVLIK